MFFIIHMLNTEVFVCVLQNVDPFDKPWLKLAAKTPAKPAGTKGRVTSARIRGSLLTLIHDFT